MIASTPVSLRPFRSAAAGALCLVWLLQAGSAQATTALYVTDDEQAALSTAVVVARIGAAEVGVDPKWKRTITRTEVLVDEVLVGKAPARLEIEQFGGTRNGETLYIPGDARFREGERCVLFLRKVDGGWFLTAMEQSKYKIVEAARGELLQRDLTEGLVIRDPSFQLRPYHEPPTKPIKTLSAFRKAMKGAKPEGAGR